MSPNQQARKFQAVRGVDGRISVALGLGLPVAPIVLTPAVFPTSNGKNQTTNGAKHMTHEQIDARADSIAQFEAWQLAQAERDAIQAESFDAQISVGGAL